MSARTVRPSDIAQPQAGDWRRRKMRRDVLSRTVAYVVLTLGCVLMVVPFLWMVSTSLKQEGSVYVFPPVWIPHPLRWDNYTT